MFSIDKASGLPIYLQIKHQAIYLMSIDRLAPGSVLPSFRQLATSLGVTTSTVAHAYAALEAEGLVVSYPGKGVVVAELSADAREQASRRWLALLEPFGRTIRRARALGYTTEEIRSAALRALAANDHRRVALVASEPEFVDRYTRLLSESLSDLRVEVDGIVLRDLRERGPAVLNALDPLSCIATLVRSYAEVRDLLRGSPLPVIGIALELAPETQAELLALPVGSRALLVAERINLTGMAHLVEQYWAPDGGLPHIALESRELAAPMRDAEIVIHSLHAKRTVGRLAVRTRKRVELHFVVNPVSLARLRAVLSRDEAQAGKVDSTESPCLAAAGGSA